MVSTHQLQIFFRWSKVEEEEASLSRDDDDDAAAASAATSAEEAEEVPRTFCRLVATCSHNATIQ